MTKIKILFCFTSLIFMTSAFGQGLLKIREVYDFNIGDEFQFKVTSYGQGFPNADRIKVIDKITSTNNDSITYIYYHDRYSSTLNYQTQRHEYSFWHYNSTEIITNLDSTILNKIFIDTTSRKLTINFDSLCDVSIDGFYLKDKNDFEPSYKTYEYGKGLGLIKYEEFDPSGPSDWETTMYYYNKQGIKCGNPDLTTKIENKSIPDFVKIYPNPLRIFLFIEIDDDFPSTCTFSNLTGNIVLSNKLYGKQFKIDLSGLPAGVYVLNIENDRKIFHQKVIKQ